MIKRNYWIKIRIFRYGYACETPAVIERISDISHTVGKFNACHLCAAVKGVIAYIFYSVRDRDLSQTVTVLKGTITDTHHGLTVN